MHITEKETPIYKLKLEAGEITCSDGHYFWWHDDKVWDVKIDVHQMTPEKEKLIDLLSNKS